MVLNNLYIYVVLYTTQIFVISYLLKIRRNMFSYIIDIPERKLDQNLFIFYKVK